MSGENGTEVSGYGERERERGRDIERERERERGGREMASDKV